MAKVSNNFIKGKMNKDLDDRLIPVGEYRNAINAQVSRSEGPNVGALENVLGNIRVSDMRQLLTMPSGFSIGYCADEINNRVFIFLTDNTLAIYDNTAKNAIVVYSATSNATTVLVTGVFLNFSTLNPITGVNILEDLLYFTDNRNQPRVINVTFANPNGANTPTYYETEDQISVAKYNPYQSIELYKISSDLNPTEYESTMYDVVSKFYPDGGLGILNADVASGATSMQILKASFQSDLIVGATIAFIDTTSPGTFTTTTLTVSSVQDNTTYWTVATGGAALPDLLKATTEVVFNYNYYYDIKYNGDENLLKDKFVRFAYRFKYVDGEYSIISPFTQECFIPKQDGYFMYKRNPKQNTITVPTSPLLEIQDEEDTFRTTTVDFMENKVNKILLRIPLPQSSNILEQDFKISELDVLYKESTSSNIRVVETVPVARIRQGDGRGDVNGAITNSATLVIDDISGSIKPGMSISGSGIVNNPVVISFDGTSTVVMSSPQSIANNALVVFGQRTHFEYEYQSTKPYKVLPSSDTTRTYDKIPVRALSQEVISNRIVYGNFLDKHTPPTSIDYNLAVSEKSSFNLGIGQAATTGTNNSGVTIINTATATGTLEAGYIVTANVAGIQTDSVVVSFTASSVTIDKTTNASIAAGSILTFTAPSNVRWTTSTVEYPNSSLKQNRNYQVGVILSDKFGRSSTVILSDGDNSVTFNDQQFLGSTVYSDYIPGETEALQFPGNSLKILFNNPIPGGVTGIYNGDPTDKNYNPLGWYSYKIVVKQTEQEYYNVYLPGIMAAYPNDALKELGKTSHAVLFNDNINKVPRDLLEVGPEQKQFRSSVVLNGRVQNTNTTDVWQNNIQYYPGTFPGLVSVIATDDDLFNGITEINYTGSAEFYNVISNPLIARINTPSKKLGTVAVITTGEVAASQTGAGALDQLNIDISTISPIYSAVGQLVPSGSIVAGQLVNGPGVPVGTIVNSATSNNQTTPVTFKITFNQNLEGTSAGDVLTFSPTQPGPVDGPFITMPQLAVMETDPVESDLEIFWETTTEGLITELNQAILGGTADSVSISGFSTDLFKESLAPGGKMLTTPFSLKDQFGNTIVYEATTPAQLQLNSVEDFNGDDVSSNFDLVLGASANTYNIETAVPFYFSNQAATLQTFKFNFEVNYAGVQTFLVQQPVSLINVAPTIETTCSNVTYIPGTSGGSNGTIATLAAQNGAVFLVVGFDPVAWKDLSWTISVAQGSTGYNVPTGTILVNGTVLAGKQWQGRIYFAGDDPPIAMIDGDYVITATVQDAGGLTASCNFTLTIDRDACFTYKFTYTGSNALINVTYTGCNGEGEIATVQANTPSNQFPGYSAVCAPDNTTALTDAGFVKLALDSTDMANVCNS